SGRGRNDEPLGRTAALGGGGAPRGRGAGLARARSPDPAQGLRGLLALQHLAQGTLARVALPRGHGAPGPAAHATRGPQLAPARRGPVPGPTGDLAVPLAREGRSEEHTSELQSLRHLVCRLLLEK